MFKSQKYPRNTHTHTHTHTHTMIISHTCAYQGINVSFLENFANVLNE